MTEVNAYSIKQLVEKWRNTKEDSRTNSNSIDDAFKELNAEADKNRLKRIKNKSLLKKVLAGAAVGVALYIAAPFYKEYKDSKEQNAIFENSLSTRVTLNSLAKTIPDSKYAVDLIDSQIQQIESTELCLSGKDYKSLDKMDPASDLYGAIEDNYCKALEIYGESKLYSKDMSLSELARLVDRVSKDKLKGAREKLYKTKLSIQQAESLKGIVENAQKSEEDKLFGKIEKKYRRK